MLKDHDRILFHLRELQRLIRQAVVGGRDRSDLARVDRVSSADTIYGIDAVIEPVIEQYLEHWSIEQPLVVIAEGIEPETGRCFPPGINQSDAEIRIILDPVDGTRGLMYDKRAAWSLAGVAPNRGVETRLRDIEVAVMTELPTRKMGWGDVLWAVRGRGARAVRETIAMSVDTIESVPLPIARSRADTIAHGFAMVSNFFPGTKVLASELMENLVRQLLGPTDLCSAMVFDDQYICTGGQFYELIVGHDRFNADLRPAFYRMQRQPEGLCCHPYDCATALIAEEAGVILTNERGQPLDGPLDTVTGMSWIGYANEQLRAIMEPLVLKFFAGGGSISV